jgi:hypothetical protein
MEINNSGAMVSHLGRNRTTIVGLDVLIEAVRILNGKSCPSHKGS